MGDEALRALERTAAAHGGEEQAVRAFAARLRSGQITLERAQLAAVLGWGPARGALGLDPLHGPGCHLVSAGGSPPEPEHAPGDLCADLSEVELVERLVRFSPAVGVRLGLEVARRCARRIHYAQAGDDFETCGRTRCVPNRVALKAIEAWCDEAGSERGRLAERLCLQASGPGARWLSSLGHACAAWSVVDEVKVDGRPAVGVTTPAWLHEAARNFLLEAVVDGLDLLTGPDHRGVERDAVTDALLTWALR